MSRAFRFAFSALLLGACALNALAADASCYTRGYGPKAAIKLAKPTLRWEVWPGGGSKITSFRMTLNGVQVDAAYNEKEKVLEYCPSEPLEPGNYKVSCAVEVDGYMPMDKSWSFNVQPTATAMLRSPSAGDLEVLKAANRIRSAYGLPLFVSDDRLYAASYAHVGYLSSNNKTGHWEQPGSNNFIGEWPSDRLEAYGYVQNSWEVVDCGSPTAQSGIAALFDAPYHRIPFLQPGTLAAGGAMADRRLTMEFEMSREVATTVSPHPDETGVPRAWDGNERPSPLRLHKVDGPVGYPIMVCRFTPESDPISVKSFELQDAFGNAIPCYLNAPGNDKELTFAAFLMPKKPLAAQTLYTASVVFVDKSGNEFSKTWSFTTGTALPKRIW